MKQLIDDIRWAIMMIRIRRFRRTLLFSEREVFDIDLQHKVYDGDDVAHFFKYPDTIYITEQYDFDRAVFYSPHGSAPFRIKHTHVSQANLSRQSTRNKVHDDICKITGIEDIPINHPSSQTRNK